jgi:3-isopropylmalate dehydratase small subunit
VTTPAGLNARFEIDGFRKQLLLIGRDEIDLTLDYEAQIGQFEERQRSSMPWLSERYRV